MRYMYMWKFMNGLTNFINFTLAVIIAEVVLYSKLLQI